VKEIAYPRGAVRVSLTEESKGAFPLQAPGSFPGRTVGEALEKLQRCSNRMLTKQHATTCRSVFDEVFAEDIAQASCDSCQDDVSIDCHDCEQHQAAGI
jgi:hypothetical protein